MSGQFQEPFWTSEPGQKNVAASTPWVAAVAQSGSPPHHLGIGIVVGHAEVVPRDWVGEVVVDDAVGGGVEAGDDGVVVGECERGEDGDQALGGGGAIGEEAADVREGGLELARSGSHPRI